MYIYSACILWNILVLVLYKIILSALKLLFTGRMLIIKILYENFSYAVTNTSLLLSVTCCAIILATNAYK